LEVADSQSVERLGADPNACWHKSRYRKRARVCFGAMQTNIASLDQDLVKQLK
jgi:hypothetical protein